MTKQQQGELSVDALGEKAADQHRKLQREIDDNEKSPEAKEREEKEEGAMQAGARSYPEPPFAKQHQTKPGSEADLDPAPMYDAPFYKGSGKLEGKVAIVTGGDSGIGRSIAVLYAREGADVAVIYLDEHEDAEVTRQAVQDEGQAVHCHCWRHR